ncbi:LysR substrate-binding domain-containing protein [Tistrella bauzanensis]|uniref:LysR substrate-binding domain-containing protein n=1 Tax=Tistrella arctica TaxID=3133430 RepID=A0ABU9YG59_9PROT
MSPLDLARAGLPGRPDPVLPAMDVDLLRALVAVIDCGGFTAAADRLNLTQSAVSMQLRRLEDRLGRKLVDRERRGVRPTADGEVLIGYARRILALNDEAVLRLLDTGARGRVRIGAPDDYASIFLPPIIARFAAANPRVEIEVRCALSPDLEAEMDQGAHDLILVTRREGHGGGTLIRREQLVWAAAPDHRPETMTPLPLALFPDGCAFRPHALQALDRAGRPWRVALTSGSLAGIQSAVANGLAITALARSTVPAGWRLLGAAEGFPPLPAVEIALKSAGQPSEPVRVLLRHLLDTLSVPDPTPDGPTAVRPDPRSAAQPAAG